MCFQLVAIIATVPLVYSGFAVANYFKDKSDRTRNGKVLEVKLPIYESNINSVNSNIEFMKSVIGSKFFPKENEQIFAFFVKALALTPESRDVHKLLFNFLSASDWAASPQIRNKLYNTLLSHFAQYNNTISKQNALQIARWNYSLSRPEGALTIYDEQAIANDMNSIA